MKKLHINSICHILKTLLVVALLALPTCTLFAFDIEQSTSPNTSSPCGDLVKECIVVTGFERDACFHASATHPFCRGSELADLLIMRWEYSPSRKDDFEIAPSNTGSQVNNSRCLSNVDNKLAAMLFSGTLTHQTVSNLIDELANCKEKLLIDLVRP